MIGRLVVTLMMCQILVPTRGWAEDSTSHHSASQSQDFDVVVYGGTSAGVVAAIEAKRLGKSVVVVAPEKHLGGLSAGGLGWTDTGNKATIGGLAREFYHRVWKHYQQEDAWRWQSQESYGNRGQGTPAIDGTQRTMWIFEPHVAEQIFEDMIAEENVPVFRQQQLDRDRGVEIQDGRISRISTLQGLTFDGKMFIDATYEGDLLAAAGVGYHVGREANSIYGETYNGIQVGVLHHKHWFSEPISAYRTPGKPETGLLPKISAEPPGEKGQADTRIQAYCFRMCLTNEPKNRIPFPKPEGYDPEDYALLSRLLSTGWSEFFAKFDPIPNLKTDTNNHGPFSTDNIGMNYEYPEASYEKRSEIIEEHRRYQQGYLYFLANDPAVPQHVRDAISKWGLAADEFKDNNNWPHQIYVREALRMIGEYVMTEHDCLDKKETPEPIGMGSYTLDSHNVQRYIKPDGTVQNEGDIGVKVPRPYEIALGSILPKKNECENLLVPVCVSSSHIAFGSIRMEPVFMILGHSAAATACIAIDQDIPVQSVDYKRLRQQLTDEGQVLDIEQVYQLATAKFDGVVVDDEQAKLSGEWNRSKANQPFVGLGYRYQGWQEERPATAIYRAKLESGTYQVRASFPKNSNRASNVKYSIRHKDGTSVVEVNQRTGPQEEKMWAALGEFSFEGQAEVSLSTEDADGYVILDAIQFLKQ